MAKVESERGRGEGAQTCPDNNNDGGDRHGGGRGGHNGPSSDAGERVSLAKWRNDDGERVAAVLFGRLLLSTNRDTHSLNRATTKGARRQSTKHGRDEGRVGRQWDGRKARSDGWMEGPTLLPDDAKTLRHDVLPDVSVSHSPKERRKDSASGRDEQQQPKHPFQRTYTVTRHYHHPKSANM